jgi:ubiquinone/menaquinone biosynthesis C-methylase UbiE
VRRNLADGFTILDVGGGRQWQFRDERKRLGNLKVIALDPSEEQLSYNHDADEKILFAMGTDKRVPIDDESVDLVTSRMVLEHIENNDYTMREVFRVLKPGGKFISVMPNKFALFAVINQLLPHRWAHKILFTLKPEVEGICGFRAYYDRTYYPALKKLLNRYGFTETDFKFFYNQSGYFSFFLPFALISLIWDFMMYIFGIKPMCSYVYFEAVKEK